MGEQTGKTPESTTGKTSRHNVKKWALLAIIFVIALVVATYFVVQNNNKGEESKSETPTSQNPGNENNVVYGTEASLIKDIKPSPGAEKITQGDDGNIIIPTEARENQIKVLREEGGRAFELQMRKDFATAKITFDMSNPAHLNVLNMPEEF